MSKAPGSASPQPLDLDPQAPGAGGRHRGGGQGPAKASEKRPPDQLLRAAFARASQVFGQAVSLFMQSPQHRHLPLSDLEWRVIPAIALQQYRLVQHNGAPAGFISWALVDEETEQRLQQPDFRLRPQDWKCGERVWIVDVVAPPQQTQVLLDKVTAELFAGITVQVRKGAATALSMSAQSSEDPMGDNGRNAATAAESDAIASN